MLLHSWASDRAKRCSYPHIIAFLWSSRCCTSARTRCSMRSAKICRPISAISLPKSTVTRASLIAVNYFGFPQDLPGLRQFCDDRGMSFLEDCAHSFFGSCAGRPLGSFGHFAVASLAKFFPVQEGGCLIIGSGTTTHGDIMQPRSQGLSANAAAALNGLEDAVSVGRLPALEPAIVFFRGAKRIVQRMSPSSRQSQNPAQRRSGQRGGFDPAWMEFGATAVSRAICRFASREQIAESRRRNYARLTREFEGLRRCRPIFPKLPDGVVPYMFPLWIGHLSEVFATLEDHAVAMQRFGQFLWPAMDEMTCAVSREFSSFDPASLSPIPNRRRHRDACGPCPKHRRVTR